MTAFHEVLGESPQIVTVRAQLTRLLDLSSTKRTLPPVLILGETGTGKGLLAQALHRASARAGEPFVQVNCAAIPDSLFESEVFGVERGAFTGAHQSRPGFFQAAHRGCLMLDEIGALPLALQAKLLTALENRIVRRVGGVRNEPVDVWILAATGEDLPTAVREHRFREDLYHRLSVVTVALPPLRERAVDIPLLARHFLSRACDEYDLPQRQLTADAVDALHHHRFPGNIRELANLMERVALTAPQLLVGATDLGLPTALTPSPADPLPPPNAGLRDSALAFERATIRAALEAVDWNLSQAAARLGIPRNTLRYRMGRLDLRPESPAVRRSSGPRSEAPPSGQAVEERVQLLRRHVAFLGLAINPPLGGSSAAAELLTLAAHKIK